MTNQASKLRIELRERASHWATANAIRYYSSLGQAPTILFSKSADLSSHGNFQPDSWVAIQASDAWIRRLRKPHSRSDALPVEMRATAKELDSSLNNS